MSFRWCPLSILSLIVVFLVACDNKPRKILIYSPQPAASPHAVSARVFEYCNLEGIDVDTTSSPDYLMEDSLINYSAVAFIGSSPDKLGYRNQNDVERFVQAGGGIIVFNVPPILF